MNNENVQPKKKKPVFLIILLIILGIGCIGTGYYLNESGIFNKLESEPIEEENKEEVTEANESVITNYEVSDVKIANLINNLLYVDLARGLEDSCNPFEKFVTDKKVNASDISNNIAWDIIMGNSAVEKDDSISLEEVTQAVKKYLGADYEFDSKQVDTNVCSGNYEYDAKSQAFIKLPKVGGCGGSCGDRTVYKIVKAVDTDGTLKLDVKVIFVGHKNDDYNYYSDYARTNKVADANISNFDNLYDKGSNYQFTFKLEDDNYVFFSSEPVK